MCVCVCERVNFIQYTYSAKMMWHGPNLRANRPEARKYTLIIKNCTENQMLRERGIYCLANHEIGTHFVSFLTTMSNIHFILYLSLVS